MNKMRKNYCNRDMTKKERQMIDIWEKGVHKSRRQVQKFREGEK